MIRLFLLILGIILIILSNVFFTIVIINKSYYIVETADFSIIYFGSILNTLFVLLILVAFNCISILQHRYKIKKFFLEIVNILPQNILKDITMFECNNAQKNIHNLVESLLTKICSLEKKINFLLNADNIVARNIDASNELLTKNKSIISSITNYGKNLDQDSKNNLYKTKHLQNNLHKIIEQQQNNLFFIHNALQQEELMNNKSADIVKSCVKSTQNFATLYENVDKINLVLKKINLLLVNATIESMHSNNDDNEQFYCITEEVRYLINHIRDINFNVKKLINSHQNLLENNNNNFLIFIRYLKRGINKLHSYTLQTEKNDKKLLQAITNIDEILQCNNNFHGKVHGILQELIMLETQNSRATTQLLLCKTKEN